MFEDKFHESLRRIDVERNIEIGNDGFDYEYGSVRGFESRPYGYVEYYGNVEVSWVVESEDDVPTEEDILNESSPDEFECYLTFTPVRGTLKVETVDGVTRFSGEYVYEGKIDLPDDYYAE